MLPERKTHDSLRIPDYKLQFERRGGDTFIEITATGITIASDDVEGFLDELAGIVRAYSLT